MKISAVAVALAFLVGSASAYTHTSFMGSRSALSSGRAAAGRASMRMEDFGFLKGTGIGFEDLWAGDPTISEAKLEQVLNKDGLRYKMNKTAKEAEGLKLGFDIGPLKAPRVGTDVKLVRLSAPGSIAFNDSEGKIAGYAYVAQLKLKCALI